MIDVVVDGADNDQVVGVDCRIDDLERALHATHQELDRLLAKRRLVDHYRRQAELARAAR
ncbi:MAG: hypothetical protein ACJ72N_22000 [Labedaea sp.]